MWSALPSLTHTAFTLTGSTLSQFQHRTHWNLKFRTRFVAQALKSEILFLVTSCDPSVQPVLFDSQSSRHDPGDVTSVVVSGDVTRSVNPGNQTTGSEMRACPSLAVTCQPL